MKRMFDTGHRQNQRGAATLVVVMMLFLVMALLAAYANRSLMFEQRISGSYYRASMAQEMAEGGLDWTVAMLNGGSIDADCKPVASGGTRFVDQYLAVSASDRSINAKGTNPTMAAVDCARDANGLVCRCPLPDSRTAQPSTTLTGMLVPSMGISLAADTSTRSGSFTMSSQGCTDSSVDNCIGTAGGAKNLSQKATATSYQKASIAFISAVPSSPASPLTVRGDLTTSGSGGLGLHNTDPLSAGGLVVTGGTGPVPVFYDNRMDSVPGTPPAMARVFGDTHLHDLTNTQLFQAFMGMASTRYRNHPALRQVTCPAGDCAQALKDAYDAGQRILWIQGALSIASNKVIGTVDDPLLIIANGDVTLDGPMQLTGMLVALGDLHWQNTGGLTSLITGMVLVQGDMDAAGSMDIYYRQAVANQLRNRIGSYARVSGGWIDLDTK